jgi:serine/threonine protein phosphatase 1
MLKLLKSLVSGGRTEPAAPLTLVPPGQRVYAVGDIHGRLDLFEQMIALIEADDAARNSECPAQTPVQTTVILLGDLIDRGPDSAGVIAAARAWMQRRRVRILAGNHEEMFLGAFEREETLRHFLRHGGRETLLSYPIDPDDYARMTLEELRAAMPGFVPQDDLAFLRSLEDQVRSGTMSSSMPAFVPACRLTSRCRATCAGSRRVHCRSQPARFRRGAWPHHRRRA